MTVLKDKQRSQKRFSEQGSVFFYILLGVVLFGTLAFTMSRGMRGQSTKALSDKRAELLISELLSYTQNIARTVDRLRREGCSEGDISFENDIISGYENTDAPSDLSCHVFKVEGGGAQWFNVEEKLLDKSFNGQSTYGNLTFTEFTAIDGLGSGEEEATVLLNFVTKDVCLAINKKLNIANPSDDPPENLGTFNYDTLFNGGFASGTPSPINAPELIRKPSGCVARAGSAQYHFYHVLIER